MLHPQQQGFTGGKAIAAAQRLGDLQRVAHDNGEVRGDLFRVEVRQPEWQEAAKTRILQRRELALTHVLVQERPDIPMQLATFKAFAPVGGQWKSIVPA